MGMEIERKFLVKDGSWRDGATGVHYRQGYLTQETPNTIRIRIAGDKAWITVKGPARGLSRVEFEYEIPLMHAVGILENICVAPLIEKTRYRVLVGNMIWEIDEFHNENRGLLIAEIELESPSQEFTRPNWLGEEVSHDSRYYNSSLAQSPFTTW